MGVRRDFATATGPWLVDTLAELDEVQPRFGDDAFVADMRGWYKFSGNALGWLRMSDPVVDAGVFEVTNDVEILDQMTRHLES